MMANAQRIVACGGVKGTLVGWCAKRELPLKLVEHRLKQGWTVTEALSCGELPARPLRPAVTDDESDALSYKGVTLTYDQWARRTGISKLTLRNRVEQHDWSVEDALTTPPGKLRPTPKDTHPSTSGPRPTPKTSP